MKLKRGRPSAASLVAMAQTLEAMPRQVAPSELTDEEVQVWHSVVSVYPADWFDAATVPLLAQYCRHAVQAKRLAELIERATSDKELTIQDYDRLLKMQQRESAVLCSLATKMRISQQSTKNHRGNKTTPDALKPWKG